MSDLQDYSFTPIRLIEDQPIEDLERDFLGLSPWAKMIAAAAVGTPGPFTIGVHGNWGYGKTTLLRLAKALIEVNHEDVVTVWFNAWQFEREEHPLFPLIAAIADEIERKHSIVAETRSGLAKIGLSLRALTRGMKFTGEVGMPLIGKVGVEFDADKALAAEELLGKQTNPLQAEMIYHSAFRMLEDAARAEEAGARPKIIVFVDDLDRCQPKKAVFLLESIKLILSQPGFVFVIAADRPVIESYLERRYIEQCGEQTSGRGRLYMDKIVQLPIHIPNHRSRFTKFVEQVVADLSRREKDSEAIRALVNTQAVLATGAGTNPRSLVRLINNFRLDCTLWPLIEHDPDYQKLTERIASALAFNRILQQELGELHLHLVNNQELCDVILNKGENGLRQYAALERTDDAGEKRPPMSIEEAWERAGRRPWTGESASIARTLADRSDLVGALQERGKAWLIDEKLRRVVNEFAQRERAETGAASFPEALARAITRALGLQAEEPIPADRLAKILSLDLSKTAVTDAELAYLKPLSELQELRLTGTRVTDAGLAHLKGLSQLGMLWLEDTQVTDAGLAQLKEFSQLRQLSLDGTRVTGAGLVHLKGLSQLEWLSLGGTDVTDEKLAGLKELTQLETLYLDKTDVTGAGLEYVRGLTQLRTLVLNSAKVGDRGLEHLEGMSRLQALHLDNTKVTDAGLEHLEGLSELRSLVLSGNEIANAGLAHLKGLSQLELLSLTGTQVTDAGLAYLKGLSQLQGLWLSGMQVTDAGLAHLKGLSQLRLLSLKGTRATEDGINAFRQEHPGVEIEGP